MLVTADKKLKDDDGDLTVLGQVIAKLPMDPRLGKLIFLGSLFGVMEECIVMGNLSTFFCLDSNGYCPSNSSESNICPFLMKKVPSLLLLWFTLLYFLS